MNSRYSRLLTVLLVIVIIAIIGIIAFLGYRYYKNESLEDQSEEFVDSFLNDENIGNNSNTLTGDTSLGGIDQGNTTGGSSSGNVPTFNGYETTGTLEIPKTNVKQPVLASHELSKSSLETALIEIYGPGLNQVGNTTIIGHNFRNGTFFSNNKKLEIGDKLYVTDLTGNRLSYTIYNKYETEENDSEYMTRDTQGAIEVSLSTCTDDSQRRLIIWAKADV